jgi:hypothetical protein
MIVGCLAPLAPIFRVLIAEKRNQKTFAIVLLTILCVLAFIVGASNYVEIFW